jgi:hypothetical protein
LDGVDRCHHDAVAVGVSALRVAAIMKVLIVTIQMKNEMASSQNAMMPFHATGPVWVNTQKLRPLRRLSVGNQWWCVLAMTVANPRPPTPLLYAG